MECPNCGAEVAPGDVFCGECGARLPRKERKLAVPLIGVVVAVLVVGALCVGSLAVIFWPRPTPTPEVVAQLSPTMREGATLTPTQAEVPTPTAAPLATSTVAVPPGRPVPRWPLALADDFDNPESGFSESGSEDLRYFYEDGQYGIEVMREDWVGWTWLGGFSELVMEVDLISRGEDGYGGIIFRKEEAGDYGFYYFRVSSDGQYSLRKSPSGGDWEELLDWQESPHIRTGPATNRLRVVCEGSEISLYVNDQHLETVRDSTFTEGAIGMSAGTSPGQTYALFNFDNLRVYAPAAGPAVLFEDDFGDPGSGWDVADYENGSVGYEAGIYFVIAREENMPVRGMANRSFDDFVIEVVARQTSAGPTDNNEYGLICRGQPNGDGYYLVISGDGFYGIWRREDGEFEALVDWTASDVIQQGNATNRLRAVCDGADLVLFVNDELLGQASDSTFSEGDIGLTATTYEDEPTEIHFDDLVVFEALGGPRE